VQNNKTKLKSQCHLVASKSRVTLAGKPICVCVQRPLGVYQTTKVKANASCRANGFPLQFGAFEFNLRTVQSRFSSVHFRCFVLCFVEETRIRTLLVRAMVVSAFSSFQSVVRLRPVVWVSLIREVCRDLSYRRWRVGEWYKTHIPCGVAKMGFFKKAQLGGFICFIGFWLFLFFYVFVKTTQHDRLWDLYRFLRAKAATAFSAS